QQGQLPPDIKVSITRDSSRYIHSNVDDVMMSLYFGGFLAVLITFLFLQNGRATIIGAIAIPTSIIATFFLMKAMHFTLNNMSLMGLSLAVGILIDDAIVVIENVFRHMEKGKPALQAAAEGTSEIALAVMATTLCILAVFVPVGNMGEVIGQFFKQFGLTVAFAVAFSLFVAFTLTPTLSAYWLKVDHTPAKPVGILKWIQKILDAWEHTFINLRDSYKQLLSWALKRPKKLIALAVLSLFVNMLLVPFLGTEFQPAYDSGEFNIMLEAPAGTSLERMQQLIQPIEEEVLQISGLETAFVVIGAQRNPVYKATIGVRMIPSDQRSVSMLAIMDELRIKFRNVQGLKVAVQSNQGVGGGDSRPVQIGLRGPDLIVLQQLARELADNIRQIQGTVDVDMSGAQSELEVQIRLDPARMGQVGIDATLAGNAIQTAFLGITTKNQFNIADKDYNIRVQMPQSSRSNIDDVANLRIVGKGGNFVRLGDIAEVKFSSGPTQIDREGRQRQVIVYANAIGVSSGDVINQ
ncbi:MAG TPA: efflux RND transporter permease subunit, partial [Negativicutes bacterium]